jgi:hypothetical protein
MPFVMSVAEREQFLAGLHVGILGVGGGKLVRYSGSFRSPGG